MRPSMVGLGGARYSRTLRRVSCTKVDPMDSSTETVTPRPVRLDIAGDTLHGDLSLPSAATSLVIFAHGSGSSRHSARNRAVAEALQHARLATLLLDLL